MMPKFSFLLATFLTVACWGRGGSVVGNGAGLVENNFQYAYATLSSLVKDCLGGRNCEMTSEEDQMLQKMAKVFEVNSSHKDRILFVSERKNPGFFETGVDEKHRIAKTGSTPLDPIYINVDLLYDDQGQPAIEFPSMVSLLAHEVGHQAGELNHAWLDLIGSKLRQVLLQRMAVHEIQVPESGEQVRVWLINHTLPVKTAEIFFSWQGMGVRSETAILTTLMKCRNPEDTLSGFQFENGHYFIPENKPASMLGFGMWAILSCYSEQDQVLRTERLQLRFRISRDLKFEFFDQALIP